ncbi:methyltransferase [Christiangramia flava]|uniref:site-specific DNA-methyltransferase (cytosine-N(4)-specific) n=1 Tax=Christiangramia flava JLT2011 TaxID=1229726 RepID=A0A1L7I9D1_9FLAO|nr:methyltransferase [Christiangramia flava]APU69834.1 DNA modification methyltransferase [Christiangramia flava JLT2011]OSS37850.1 DNA modification methyltransferase [Christiangramia flava JLT2011]
MSLVNLHRDIGTAKDNRNSPIHDWYRFTAGFSYKLVQKIIEAEKLGSKDCIYESFAGCGTTLVSAQKNGIKAVGNEGQELLYNVIKGKLDWSVDISKITRFLTQLERDLDNGTYKDNYHELLKTLYSESDLYQLYFIRDYISKNVSDERLTYFLNLALTQSLHKVSIHPIAIPYISRSKTLNNSLSALDTFKNTVIKMKEDLEFVKEKELTTEIFLHDSRRKNENINDGSCSICITSPPYLNNLDYGEVSKVCSHFFGFTNDWNEITEKVRKNLVTGATTHYKESEFEIEKWKREDFYLNNRIVMDNILKDIFKIETISKTRKGKKSFHILALYYFQDMYQVFLEMRRVLRKGSKAYLVLGDSAPYGVFIDTTKVLGEIAKNCGFNKFEIIKIRERGTKWQSLTHRHNLKLSENILLLE